MEITVCMRISCGLEENVSDEMFENCYLWDGDVASINEYMRTGLKKLYGIYNGLKMI